MLFYSFTIVLFYFVNILHCTNAFSGFGYLKEITYCRFRECCTSEYLKNDVDELKHLLNKNVFGQHIVQEVLVSAIGAHFKNIESSRKPLVISFHGPSGTGKNFVADFVAKSLYKEGTNSKYVHKFTADMMISDRLFPNQQMLADLIKAGIEKCPYSLFIFDEIEKMKPGVFDAIGNFLDHHSSQKKYDFSKGIFIFLSNSASKDIARELKKLTDAGRFRDQTTLQDFESITEGGAFTDKGALYKSNVIASHVIDHFVPFLPLEPRHVEMCIKTEFNNTCKSEISDKKISDILKEAMTYDETGIYSNSGCKRLSKKVEVYCYKDEL